ncbi:MAG: hypothetical protein HY791_20930 [Deltaproteobacteria bacterium]|nr:hypothetical protein [Deltaproteobacteria bacterium]
MFPHVRDALLRGEWGYFDLLSGPFCVKPDHWSHFEDTPQRVDDEETFAVTAFGAL